MRGFELCVADVRKWRVTKISWHGELWVVSQVLWSWWWYVVVLLVSYDMVETSQKPLLSPLLPH